MHKFFGFDFDRTLFNTELAVEVFQAFLEAERPELAEVVRRERRYVEKSGGSYDLWTSVEEQESASADLAERFIATAKLHERDFLLPGAKELLDAIQDADYNRGIMTYGGEAWQRIKLRLAGLEAEPALILDTSGIKGKLVAEWYDASEKLYRLPDIFGRLAVENVVIIEDKLSELEGLPQDGSAQGYLARSHARSDRAASEGEVSSAIIAVDSLHDIIEREF